MKTQAFLKFCFSEKRKIEIGEPFNHENIGNITFSHASLGASLQRPYSVPTASLASLQKPKQNARRPQRPCNKPSKTAFQQCRFHICASQRKLAIIDPFKPCPGTVDGINFANLRRWVICINLWSVRSPRSPLCKVESWQRTARWPAQGEV